VNADGTALIVVTHDPAVAARARRTVRMRDGRIVEETRCS
jgi:predicted ABC-type transport system involved in lysophospholipase L1 biosynthesis ATPase subunit